MDEQQWSKYIRIEDICFFSRAQLLEQDYDPITDGVVDLAYLKERYGRHARLDHAADRYSGTRFGVGPSNSEDFQGFKCVDELECSATCCPHRLP
ncbi:MAG: hypothetical protein GTO14_07550 [Anaerolineales bacterium]|nr:hypothetical protein [Anaerolineales bacterium]